MADAGLVIHNGLPLRCDPPEHQLRPGMVPLDVIYQVPLLRICRVTINAIKLFNVIVYVLPVCLHCSSPSKQLSTYVAREVPLPMMNNVDMVL